MGARDVLDRLRGAGMSVTWDGDDLMVGPKDRLTDSMRQGIRAHRAELIAALTPSARAPSPTAGTRPRTTTFPRIYRLTRQQADDAHAEAWNDEDIQTFNLRRDTLMRGGFHEDDADDLAERLTLRDRELDDRHVCTECKHYRLRRCGNRRLAGLDSPDVGRALVTLLQRCPGFNSNFLDVDKARKDQDHGHH